MQEHSSVVCFSGKQNQYSHTSAVLGCDMVFSVFLPPQSAQEDVPMLVWLSGLTCTDQNFVTKAGAQQFASKYGIAILCPDTSPRGDDIPDDPEEAYDFGLGAGFYLDATQNPWSKNYKMRSYIMDELLPLTISHLPIAANRISISGHSMGGHGALTLGLNNPDIFKCISAFSPIVAPMQCPWGKKAFSNYLGDDQSQWQNYDASVLTSRATNKIPVLVDQGDADSFLEEQLKTEVLIESAKAAAYPMNIRYQEGYDHSYFFIASFIGEHIEFHAQHLGSV